MTLNGEPRKPMADQITTVNELQLRRRQGYPSREDIDAVERVVAAQPGLKGTFGSL